MAITKDKGSIRKFGGGELWYQKCTDEGTPSSSDAWATMGYIGESKLSDITESEGINDETGNQVASLEANRVVKFSGLFMQTNKDLIDFLTSRGSYASTGARGNFYNIYHNGGTLNGLTQEFVYGICTIKPMVEVATGTKRIPFEFTVLKNESAISSITVVAPDGNKITTATIPAGEYYVVYETTT